jgi:hypothetical protein
MRKFKAYVIVYHLIDDIEANSMNEAQEKASNDYIWDDHIKDVIIDVEEVSDETESITSA